MPATAKPWRLSLAHLTVDDADPFELIDAAAAAGFNSVGVRVVSAAGAPPRAPVAGDEDLIGRVKAALALSGVGVLQVNSFWLTPQTSAVPFASVVDAAARLGAENILVVVADPDLERGAGRFAECCAAAEQAGISVALEFHSYSAVRSLPQALGMVERSGSRLAGIVLDVLHFDRCGGRVADLASLPAGRLRFVQLCDAPALKPAPEDLRREARSGRLYPGEGELPLFDLLDALPARVPLDVEAPHAAAAHLPFLDQAQLAAQATRRFLDAYAQRARQMDGLRSGLDEADAQRQRNAQAGEADGGKE
jgi:sugar phosphate isomerase/epimerase